MTYQIVGRAASSGVHRGFARILTGPKDYARVANGDVAVSRTATPELALVLDRAGAVVTDVGGVLSHVAVVARELGIPVVVATDMASLRIADGDLVTVDGNRGIVTVDDG
jgi:pyruvate,water dikinase